MLINIKSFKNYVFIIYLYWTSRFHIKLTNLLQEFKILRKKKKLKKLRLDRMRMAKLKFN